MAALRARVAGVCLAFALALGVKVKPAGNRPLQLVVNKFFYWLRASMLETRRVAYWWADRMLNTKRPLRGENDPVRALVHLIMSQPEYQLG